MCVCVYMCTCARQPLQAQPILSEIALGPDTTAKAGATSPLLPLEPGLGDLRHVSRSQIAPQA